VIDAIHHLVNSLDLSPLTDHLMLIDEKEVDIIGNFQRWFSNFVKSGQAWALLIGTVIGYMFKGFTSY
jgi:hypothetical protein